MITIQAPTGFGSRGRGVLATHPGLGAGQNADLLAVCLEACADCAQACLSCADACLGESNVAELVTCIRFNQDCADTCIATFSVLSRQLAQAREVDRALLQACSLACQKCGDECARHAKHMEHCRVCASACEACTAACEALLQGAPQG
jgi:hypothetical protein